MASVQITIINKLGLHARAAAKFVATAANFEADIQLCREQRCVNGKSIMGIMMLAASQGTEVSIHADGADAENALEQLTELVNNKFDEAE